MHKGAKPIEQRLDRWTAEHVVANMMRTGTRWFSAWRVQKGYSLQRLAQITGIPARRILTIDLGDCISRAELDAFARAWTISSEDLIASMPTPDLLVDRKEI